MREGEHLKKNGLITILKLAFSMNSNGKYRKLKLEGVISVLESSETVRQTLKKKSGKDTVRTA